MEFEKHPKITPIYVSIQKSNCQDHQLIYASQLYGTFFAVSGRLLLKEKIELIGMELTLINYKGLFNIGILPQTKKVKIDDKGHASLELHLSALYGKHGTDNRVNVSCEPFKIENLKYLNVTRKLWSFTNYENGNHWAHLDDEHFDNEFYERDGSVIFKKNRMDIVSSGSPSNIEENENGIKTSPTGQCKNTFSKFV